MFITNISNFRNVVYICIIIYIIITAIIIVQRTNSDSQVDIVQRDKRETQASIVLLLGIVSIVFCWLLQCLPTDPLCNSSEEKTYIESESIVRNNFEGESYGLLFRNNNICLILGDEKVKLDKANLSIDKENKVTKYECKETSSLLGIVRNTETYMSYEISITPQFYKDNEEMFENTEFKSLMKDLEKKEQDTIE